MRTLFQLFWLLVATTALACNSSTCNDVHGCAAGQACIKGGTCATSCSPDGGAPCPAGTTCQPTSGYCQGTACAAIEVWVCR